MLKTFLYPVNASFTHIWQLIKPDNQTMLGIGRTSAWSIESTPPAPEILVEEVEEIIGYVPLKLGKVAKRVLTQTSASFGLDGKFYETVTAESLAAVRAAQSTQVYLEFEVDHSLISAPRFRTLGLYENVVFSQALQDAAVDGVVEYKALYQAEDLIGDLVYIENFPPVSVTANLKQTIKLVLNA